MAAGPRSPAYSCRRNGCRSEVMGVVAGIGVNVAAGPEGVDYPATSFAALGSKVTAEELFTELAESWIGYERLWDNGNVLPRSANCGWNTRRGSARRWRFGPTAIVRGRFQTIDDEGCLVVSRPAESGGSRPAKSISAPWLRCGRPAEHGGPRRTRLRGPRRGRRNRHESRRLWLRSGQRSEVDRGRLRRHLRRARSARRRSRLPDISILQKLGPRLLGIVITHGHEDHYGALAALWPRLARPCFCLAFVEGLLAARHGVEAVAKEIRSTASMPAAACRSAPSTSKRSAIAHSIPETMALAIRTPLGTVIHTGDWKLDPEPEVGPPTDEARLRRIGEEGVLALVCDSTNAIRPGRSPSEGAVAKELKAVVARRRAGLRSRCSRRMLPGFARSPWRRRLRTEKSW